VVCCAGLFVGVIVVRKGVVGYVCTVRVKDMRFPPIEGVAVVHVRGQAVYICDGARCKHLPPRSKIILNVFDASQREHKARIVCAVGLNELPD